jgi:hypothetical protein
VNPDGPPGGGAGGFGAAVQPTELYAKILHDPAHRDPRGYILPANQADFATATEFINALLKNGITILKATSQFTVNGKTYPEGSYVVKTAQAFRPHVMDMFEPQDHPNDFAYPGGPPHPPYDITGWTLAMQMGVQYDRVFEGFDGPFTKINGLLDPPPGKISGAASPAGYLVSHKENNTFKMINRLLKANCDVYWLKNEQVVNGVALGTGTVWVPASANALPVLTKAAKEFGVDVYGVMKVPAGEAMKLKPIRIGLYDQYGGLMPAGWTKWLFEQYEFPFETVYPQTLDAGDLKAKFDVLVFTDGAMRRAGGGRGGGGGGGGRGGNLEAMDIPDEFKGWTGRISEDKTMPQIKKFVESGGSVVTIGSSTSMGELLGVPVKDYLTEKGPDGKDRSLPREKFYIPGSLLKANIDNTNPLAYGMPSQVDVFYDNSPVFKMAPDSEQKKTSSVGWFSGPNVLDSGWAWGQQYLDGGTAVAEASVGEGKVMLLGPEVAFRAQPHATFKLLFNGLYLGSAKPETMK